MIYTLLKTEECSEALKSIESKLFPSLIASILTDALLKVLGPYTNNERTLLTSSPCQMSGHSTDQGIHTASGLHNDSQDHDLSEEAAASKLWAVYVSEAEKYDKSLVESWKSDMEGMLIFVSALCANRTYVEWRLSRRVFSLQVLRPLSSRA